MGIHTPSAKPALAREALTTVDGAVRCLEERGTYLQDIDRNEALVIAWKTALGTLPTRRLASLVVDNREVQVALREALRNSHDTVSPEKALLLCARLSKGGMGRIEIGGLVANGLVAADDLPRLESNSERLRVNLQGGIDRMDRPKESGGQPAEFHIDMLARAMGAMSLKAEQQKPGLAASLRVSGEKPPASLQERIDAIASAAKALAKEEAAPPKRSVEDVINANLDWARAQMARIRVMTRSLKVQTVKHQLELNARNVDRTTELLTALFSSPEVLTTEEWTGVVKTMDPGVRRFIATKARGVGRNDLARALTLDDEPGAVPDNIRNVERRHAAARKGLHA